VIINAISRRSKIVISIIFLFPAIAAGSALAASDLSSSAINKAEESVQARGKIVSSKAFSCQRAWGPSKDRQLKRARIYFRGQRQGARFLVRQTIYHFSDLRGSVALRDKNNINVFPARPGSRALWNSPDNLRAGRRSVHRQSFYLPRNKRLRVAAIFDIIGSDPSCSAFGRLP
jgi:hypothetical protein